MTLKSQCSRRVRGRPWQMSTIVWLEPQTPTLPRPADQTSEVQGSQGRAPSTGSREAPSCLFQLRGLQASPGWWPRPSRLCLRLHAASPLSLCTLLVRKPLFGRRTRQWDLISSGGTHSLHLQRVTCRQGGILRCHVGMTAQPALPATGQHWPTCRVLPCIMQAVAPKLVSHR